MSLRKASLAAALAVSMVSAPVIAQTAQVQTSAAAAAATQRSGADMEDANELRGGFIIPLIALIAIILGLCAATDICGGDDNDPPTSP